METKELKVKTKNKKYLDFNSLLKSIIMRGIKKIIYLSEGLLNDKKVIKIKDEIIISLSNTLTALEYLAK